MIHRHLAFLLALSIAPSLSAATNEDIAIAQSQLAKAQTRLEVANQQLQEAEETLAKQRAVTNKARQEVEALKQLLKVYGLAIPLTEKEAAENTKLKVASEVRRELSAAWYIPSTTKNGTKAMLEMKFDSNGTLISANISRSSGNTHFDNSVLQAAHRIKQFESVHRYNLSAEGLKSPFSNAGIMFRAEGLPE